MTCKYRFLLASTFVLALLSSPARAQTQPDDLKCLLLSNLYAKQATDEKLRAIALQASFFYLGRVSGPAAAIQSRMKEEAKALSTTDNGERMAACANAMVKRVGELSAGPEQAPAQPSGR